MGIKFDIFPKKKPACKDLGYVIGVQSALKNAYANKEYELYRLNEKDEFKDFDSLEKFILNLQSFFNVKLTFHRIDQIDETFDNLPIIYDIVKDDNRDIIIGITPFGYSNLDILFCELLLYLIDHKITNDGFIHFEEDFFNDYEDSYRPFLVMVSVYFGFGHMLLKRFWISGSFRKDLEILDYKYYIPLDVNYLIFAICYKIYSSRSEKDEQEFISFTNDFSREIRKEIAICFSYLRKNGESLFIESVNSFYWKSIPPAAK